MHRLLFALLLATAADTTADRIAWLKENTVAIRTLDPQDHDFADLQPLKRSLGNVRIVSLGGVSPDPAGVQARQRLVRFLHDEMGFDVLACDVPLFDGEEIDQALGGETAPRVDLRQEFAPILNSTGFLDYVRATHQTARPLHFTGFGMQMSSYIQTDFAKQLFHFIDRVGPHIASSSDRKAVKALLDAHESKQLWDIRLGAAKGAIARVSEGLGRLVLTGANARELLLYRQTLSDLSLWTSGQTSNPALPNAPNSLLWLAKVWNADRKIIVWSNNSGIVRDLPNQQNPGTAIAKEFGKNAYSIALDEINPAAATAVPHLEDLLHATGQPYTFLDLRGLPADHWLREPLAARLLPGQEFYAWPIHFDAILSIDASLAKSPK